MHTGSTVVSVQHNNTKHVMLWENPRELMAINVSLGLLMIYQLCYYKCSTNMVNCHGCIQLLDWTTGLPLN